MQYLSRPQLEEKKAFQNEAILYYKYRVSYFGELNLSILKKKQKTSLCLALPTREGKKYGIVSLKIKKKNDCRNAYGGSQKRNTSLDKVKELRNSKKAKETFFFLYT